MEAYMAMNDRECSFEDGIEKLVSILTGIAGEIESFAESFGVSGEEIAELNARKTQKEIELEDVLAAQVAAPLVNALDGLSGILNGATAKVAKMTADLFNGEAQGA
jgi:hypothetical protein